MLWWILHVRLKTPYRNMKVDRVKLWNESLCFVTFSVLLLTFLCSPVICLTRSGFTFQHSDFTDIVTQDSVIDYYQDISSQTECATKCISKPECFSFFYNERTLACQTHCRVFHQTDGSFVKSHGESYHQISYDTCSPSDVIEKPQQCKRYGPELSGDHKECGLFLDKTTTTTGTTVTTTIIPIYETAHSQPGTTCRWDGTSPFCSGSCQDGWTFAEKSKSGDGSTCWTGYKYKCCMDGSNCVQLGTKPFCNVWSEDCFSRGQNYISSSKVDCMTGSKVACCDFQPQLGCNGDFKLCDLPFDKVTFAGSHNSGAGYDGLLYSESGIPVVSCWGIYQTLSFTNQLTIGVRYFDIDICWKDNRLYICNDEYYSNHLTHGLDQISKFLSRIENHNEVVAMRFQNFNNVPSEKSADLIRELTTAFSGVGNRPGLNDQKRQFGRWPTLREAIHQNKRVFVYIHKHLCSIACRNEHQWVLPEYYYKDTWKSRSVVLSCESVIEDSREKCKVDHSTLLLSVFGSYGTCIEDMKDKCNKHLRASALACLEERKKRGRTVNFLLIDYVQSAEGPEVLVRKVANEINKLNVEMFHK